MSKKPVASLSAFIASKVDATPVPVERDPPRPVLASVEVAPKRAVTAPVKPAAPEEMVTLNMRVPASFRRDLKLYAVTIGKDMSEVVREGIELHRLKHEKAKG